MSHSSEQADSTVAENGTTPAEVYAARLERHTGELARWRRLDGTLSNLRLLSFAIAAGVGWFAFGSQTIARGWTVPPVLVFIALLIAHDRVIQMRKRASRRAEFYRAGIARLEDRWMGQGNTGDEWSDPGHPYANDLDLFGVGSLFERICTARTPVGQETLADWLKTQPRAAIARARQTAIAELTPRLELREDIDSLGADLHTQFSPKPLVAWANAPGDFEAKKSLNVIAAVLSSLSIGGLVVWFWLGLGPLPFLFALIPQMIFAGILHRRIGKILAAIDTPTRNLALLRDLLARLENETADSPLLVSLVERLQTRGVSCAQRIAELRKLVDLLDARRNQLFAPIAALFLWGTQLGLVIERWRVQWGGVLEDWLSAAGQFEALASLSGYAYENPDSIFPEICEGEPKLSARALGHPLLPNDQCVRNDLELGADRRALIISGSNMSGKSTYLRTAGCNILLALAGAPVRAESLSLTPLAIAASIQINDSLLEGTSHFYAEIKRLRQIVKLSEGELPVLFLLDEILHGTNSHDRRIGASAVVRGLVERGALGLVTTHDLALAKIADEMAPAIENVHFQDHLEEGRMAFDYRVRKGVVEKSNALALMRAVGLDV
ncbi:MAG: DNA mismatch repair protein MutS [Myxococcales bacterium]|nr:DNA mismatch repair protein MutS [Myxococcales bacterium]